MFEVTFYTVSKLNVLCGPTNQKIALSRGWSYLNLLLSTIAFAGGTYWCYWDHGKILVIGVPLYIFAVIFTVIFLHYDTFCCASCCCDCCLGGCDL